MPRKCMIIDDDVDFRDSLQAMLMDEFHEVLAVPTGRDAVSKYATFSPDIVFADVRMPGLDGYGTFLLIMQEDRDARIVFMSSYDLDDKKYAQAAAMAVTDIIEKPIMIKDVRRIIREYAK